MLEVRRVVRARRQHGDGRVLLAGRGQRVQVLQQHVGVVLDRADRPGREELGEEPHHHLAVLEHVRHAGRHPQVVLEHVVLALPRADDVDAGDVRIDAAGHVHPLHLAAVLRVAEDALGRHGAGLENRLLVIDVVQEGVERAHALREPAFEQVPFVRGNDARDDVERDQPLGALLLAVDRERDADAVERPFGLLALLRDAIGRRPLEPAGERPVVRPDRPVRGAHFIVGWGRHESIFGGWSRGHRAYSKRRAGEGMCHRGRHLPTYPQIRRARNAPLWINAAPSWCIFRPGQACTDSPGRFDPPSARVLKLRLLSGFAGRLAQR